MRGAPASNLSSRTSKAPNMRSAVKNGHEWWVSLDRGHPCSWWVRIIWKFCTVFNNLETMIGMILNLNPPGQNKIRPSNVFWVFCQFLLMLNIFQGHELAKRRGVVGWAIRFWTLSKSPGNEHLMQKILNLSSLDLFPIKPNLVGASTGLLQDHFD